MASPWSHSPHGSAPVVVGAQDQGTPEGKRQAEDRTYGWFIHQVAPVYQLYASGPVWASGQVGRSRTCIACEVLTVCLGGRNLNRQKEQTEMEGLVL